MKRVCHVLFEHSIFDGRIFHKEAISLVRHGFDVTLLVPTVDKRSLGLKKEIHISKNESYESNGVKFEAYHYNKKLPKPLNIRQYFCKRDLIKKLIQIDADAYHFHEDGLTLEIAAALKYILPEKKLVFDFHEFFLNSYREKKSKIYQINRYIKLENALVKNADLVFTVTDFISSYYRTLCDCPVITLFNCQSTRIFPEQETVEEDDTFWLVHEGKLRFDRGLKLLVEIARQLKHTNIKFLCIGNLPKAEQRYFDENADIHDKFHITGFLPYHEVPQWLAQGKVGISFMMSNNAKTGISNKFFNYLRYGLPVLALHHPITDKIIEVYQLGAAFDTSDIAGITEFVRKLASDNELHRQLSQNAAAAFQSTYNWENMEKLLVDTYNRLLEGE